MNDDDVLVGHDPVWVPGPIVMDARGNTEPGFWCVHILENGNGPCAGNSFVEQSDRHHCVAKKSQVREVL